MTPDEQHKRAAKQALIIACTKMVSELGLTILYTFDLKPPEKAKITIYRNRGKPKEEVICVFYGPNVNDCMCQYMREITSK